MSVKVVCIKDHWSIRVNWHRHRRTRQVTPNTEARALEVAEKLRVALDLYGADALRMLDEPKAQEPRKIPTVAEYGHKWLAELASAGLKRSTQERYGYLVRNHIIPAFGDRPLDDLNYSALKEWIIERGKIRSRNMVRTMAGVVRAMMDEAIRDGHVAANPVERLAKFYRTAKGQRPQVDPFRVDELHAIEAKCKERFLERYVLVLVLGRTGIRVGEATGLQWQDVDERHAQLLIRRNMPRHRQAESVKTPSSERKVDLSPEVLEELRRLRKERRAELLQAGREWDVEEWIFRNQRDRPLIYSDIRKRLWNRLLDLAGLRRRGIHQLRHTWASHMLAAGADLAYVATQLGHSSPAVTLRIYTHYVPGSRRVTAAILDRKNANEMQTEAGK